MDPETVNVLLLGNSGVGKSTLAHHYDKHAAPPHNLPATLGVDFKLGIVRILPELRAEVVVRLVDVPGDPKHAPWVSSYYRGADVILAVYDVTHRPSFVALEDRWTEQLDRYARDSAVRVIMGNKLDKVDMNPKARTVGMEEGRSLSRRLGGSAFYEISALTWTVNDLFLLLDAALVEVVARRRKERAITVAKDAAQETVRLAHTDNATGPGSCCGGSGGNT